MKMVPSLKTVVRILPVIENEQSINELVEHFKVFYLLKVFSLKIIHWSCEMEAIKDNCLQYDNLVI